MRIGRVFILLVALLAPLTGAFHWHAGHVREARQQREAVDRIRALGGRVIYDYMLDENYPVAHRPRFLSTWICRLVGEDYFYGVTMVVPENAWGSPVDW